MSALDAGYNLPPGLTIADADSGHTPATCSDCDDAPIHTPCHHESCVAAAHPYTPDHCAQHCIWLEAVA